ncbi:MAG: hypothetical protein OXL96_13225 [Candidatus Poribacteria bacterium]|nr:hypothetical protein [Candidatus Poribacteria bacterium]
MSEEKTHDLHDFMRRLQDKMAANYEHIQKRASEDPGTAGDQGEENWRDLLSGWLPRTYEVVTKGRIIGQDGHTSPQVDVLVLKSIYPKQLIDEGEKIFLAAGVAAAFECKTTLKAEHIEKAVKTCVKIKNLYPVREGTPYKELHMPIVYGLLAHSHSWKALNSTPERNIKQKLNVYDYSHVPHPRLGLDLLCVADFGTWSLSKSTFTLPQIHGPNVGAITAYIGHTHYHNSRSKHFNPIGTLISRLSLRLAWEDPSLRDLADYYLRTSIDGSGSGVQRYWDSSVYKKKDRPLTAIGDSSSSPFWDEWSSSYL